METPRTSAEIFHAFLEEELEQQRKLQPEAATEDPFASPVAKKLLNALAATPPVADPPAPIETHAPLSAFVSSRAVMAAAMDDSFDLAALDANEDERRALLDASDIVVINGQRRLRLDDRERAELLAAAQDTALYKTILNDAVARDTAQRNAIGTDPTRLPSAWLRGFLSGTFGDIDAAPVSEIHAACAARERLRYVQRLPAQVPSLDEMSRRADLAELIEPLRLLIGAEGGRDGTPRRDRFVGRDPELMRLRIFVDELQARSWLEAGVRAVKRAAQAVSSTKSDGLLMLYGRGGLGKSTLIAKFLLDHALGQQRPFPCAYLDFDRAALDAERPRQLLAEIVRQVALQFPAVKTDLDQLAADIRSSLVTAATPKANASSDIQDPVARFVEIIHDHVTHGERAFLLVLDTLEVVQWNASAIASLASLVADFRAKGLDELRVVASGRADVPELHPDRPRRPDPSETLRNYENRLEEFLKDRRDIELQPLDVDEAQELCTALGKATIGAGWKDSWSQCIAGKPDDNSLRREPLSVRVAVDLVARADAADRPQLLSDIEKSGTDASGDFVARLYEKRIVNHVRDPLAKKLAWPGLVVRRITNDIARELLAPHCGITPDEAVRAVAALGQEVWMVTRSEDGTLRHRPELRSRTLPLMRKKDPGAFDAIARDAVEYFHKNRERSNDDYVEWIYHRLLLGEAPQSMEADAGIELLRRFGDVVDDFSAETASYITSRTATTRLPPQRLRQLLPFDALVHLSRTSAPTFALDDRSIDPDALNAAQVGVLPPGAPEIEEIARSLWIKTGMWTRLPSAPDKRDVHWAPYARAYTYWAAHVAPAAGADMETAFLNDCLRLLSTRLRDGQSGFRTTVQVMALARLAGDAMFKTLDETVAKLVTSMKATPRPSMQAAIRMAIVFGNVCRAPALGAWLTSRRRGADDRVQDAAMSRGELEALAEIDTDARKALKAVLLPETPQRVTDERVLATAYQALDEIMGDLYSGAPVGDQASRLFALRDEDWIVPFGYAAARIATAPSGQSVDMVEAMRKADEAGGLAASAAQIAAQAADSPAARDLRFLIECRAAWSKAVDRVLGGNGKSAGAPVPPPPPSRSDGPPPQPPPIVHKDDPQKDRWGGKPEVAGRRVRAVLDSVERDTFYFSVTVESTDGTALEPPVVFHLHDSYSRSVIQIRRIADGRTATLSESSSSKGPGSKTVSSYGVFAIGVQVLDGSGNWVSLELDLATLPNLPKRFLSR